MTLVCVHSPSEHVTSSPVPSHTRGGADSLRRREEEDVPPLLLLRRRLLLRLTIPAAHTPPLDPLLLDRVEHLRGHVVVPHEPHRGRSARRRARA